MHYQMLRQSVLLHVRDVSRSDLQKRAASDVFQPALLQTCFKGDAFLLSKVHRRPRVGRDPAEHASACSKRIVQRTQIFTYSPPHVKSPMGYAYACFTEVVVCEQHRCKMSKSNASDVWNDLSPDEICQWVPGF
jgi:hypothetical protein